MKFLFANTLQISSRYLLIVSPRKYVGRTSKQAQTWLLLLSLKYRDNKDQQTGLLVKDTQGVAWSNYNSLFDRSNTNADNLF